MFHTRHGDGAVVFLRLSRESARQRAKNSRLVGLRQSLARFCAQLSESIHNATDSLCHLKNYHYPDMNYSVINMG